MRQALQLPSNAVRPPRVAIDAVAALRDRRRDRSPPDAPPWVTPRYRNETRTFAPAVLAVQLDEPSTSSEPSTSMDRVEEPRFLPWSFSSTPPRMSPRQRRPAPLWLDEEDELLRQATGACTIRCCDVCDSVYAGAVCRCAQLAMTHPIAKILARHCASIVPVLTNEDRSPKRSRIIRYDDLEV